MRLIHENGTIHEALLALASKYAGQLRRDIHWFEANSVFQDKWRQKQLLHSYQITGEPASCEDLQMLEALGCIQPVFPPTPEEDQAWGPLVWGDPEYGGAEVQKASLLMGASRNAVVKRLHFALTCRDKFAVPNLFYLMGGARKLDKNKEDIHSLYSPTPELPFRSNWHPPVAYEIAQRTGEYTGEESESFPTTEAEMMQLVWDQSELPSEWKAVLVNTPMIHVPGPELGTYRPPNTTETVYHWLMQEQKPGYYLVVSNQPHVRYQTMVAERAMEDLLEQRKINFVCYFKGCGPTANPTLPLATHLDTLAKQFYEETFCQNWWKGIVKDCNDEGFNMRCGDVVAQGRSWWSARAAMLERLKESDNLHVPPGGYAGPFTTKAEAEEAKI